MSKKCNPLGQKFGKWTVVSIAEKVHGRGQLWNCVCECGATKKILAGTLNSGHTKRCWNCYVKTMHGENHPSWKGGRHSDGMGYTTISIGQGKKRREHILIAEKALGRKLRIGEQVHHINGIKTDNRNSNLLICSASYHRWLENKMADLYKKEHFV